MPGKLRVTLVKSPISHTARTRATVRALGLRRLGDSVDVADTPEMRGMTTTVRFLLRTEELSGEPSPAGEQPATRGTEQANGTTGAPRRSAGRPARAKKEESTE